MWNVGTCRSDAKGDYDVVPKRLAKFGLGVVEDKTKLMPFNRSAKSRFAFLGFEFYWGRNRNGATVLKRRTDRKKYRVALASFKAWRQENRRLPKLVLFAKLNRKLRGYWKYYGIRGNYKSLNDHFHHVKHTCLSGSTGVARNAVTPGQVLQHCSKTLN